MKKILFIHIPKTAGSTLKVFLAGIMDDFFIQANSRAQLAQGDARFGRVKDLADIKRILATYGGLALHVDSNFEPVRRTSDFRSLAPLLFDAENVAYFSQFTILTILRHPLRRFLSDYAFVRKMKAEDPGFLPDLHVSSVEAYLEQVHPNPMLHFLLEPDLSRARTITRTDLECVKRRMSEYPIHVGILERLDETVSMFAQLMEKDFTAADLPTLNAGREAPAVDRALEAAFYERHALDMELYEHALDALDGMTPSSLSGRRRASS